MFSIQSTTIIGIQAVSVSIETDISAGLPNFIIVGLPDTGVKESRDRIRAAIKNSGLPFPRGRVVVNLAPANLRKQGPNFDLPIALSILGAQGVINHADITSHIAIGELALSGALRSVHGVLPSAILAKQKKVDGLIVPKQNAAEAVAAFPKKKTICPETLQALVEHLNGNERIPSARIARPTRKKTSQIDLSDIRGQSMAKRGLEIAASGGHNVLFCGPPGTGKSLLAKAIPSILPELTDEEAIEVTSIASVAGATNQEGLIRTRPFRTPHHSTSAVALVGGGTWPTPGEVTLAHRGVLFLDELPEFSRHVLEHLRQPIEDGAITITRSNQRVTFPSRVLLAAAMNPCPCGYLTDPIHTCLCSPTQIHHYQKRISGPLLDRFDLFIDVPNLSADDLLAAPTGETSETVRKRIITMRTKQKRRYAKTSCLLNTELSTRDLDRWCPMRDEAKQLLEQSLRAHRLSARGFMRARKVARTIADLSNTEEIHASHVAEALQFRQDLFTQP